MPQALTVLASSGAKGLVVISAVRNKEAAGEPAANSTGRHHNVREDIGLVIRQAAREK